MKLNQIKVLAITSLILITELLSKDISSNLLKRNLDSIDQSAWAISHTFESDSHYSQAIMLPFNYPMEASFLSNIASPSKTISGVLLPTPNLNFSVPITNFSHTMIKHTSGSEILTYRSNVITDNNHYARDTNTRMPSLWQANSAMANTTSGIVFIYLKKNMGLNLDLSFRMAGNDAGHAMFESLVSNINFSYKLSDKILNMNPNYKLNVILQLSNTQYDERAVPKKIDFNKTTLRSQFISSGFTLNTKSLMFEGLIRLPIQQQAMFDLDGLLRPELQGRLGMKWHLPEYIQP